MKKFLLAFCLVVSSMASAQHILDHWTSIAFDPYSGAVGTGTGDSPRQAVDMATRTIPSRYWDEPAWCQRCIAIATTPRVQHGLRVGYAIRCGTNQREVERNALGRCYRYGNCSITESFCVR